MNEKCHSHQNYNTLNVNVNSISTPTDTITTNTPAGAAAAGESDRLVRNSYHSEVWTASASDAEKRSIDSFYDEIKLGKYHYIYFAIVGAYMLCEGAGYVVWSFLNIVLQNEWDLTDDQISFMGTVLFTGSFVGASASGIISDKYGRKNFFLVCLVILAVAGTMLAIAESYNFFLLSWTVYGLMVGVMTPLASAMVVEISPVEWRGKVTILVFGCISVGELFGLMVSYLTLDSFADGNWRIMLLIVRIPGILSLLFGFFFLRETPRYELLNNFDKGVEILNHMYKVNQGKDKEFSPKEIQKLKTYIDEFKQDQKMEGGDGIGVSLASLFNKRYARTTVLLWVIWFTFSFVYYGVLYIYPTILNELSHVEDASDETDFFPVFMSILGELPSYLLLMFMVDSKLFGRKMSLFWAFALGSVMFLGCFWARGFGLTLLVFVGKLFVTASYTLVYPFTAELYPTRFRVTGLGLCDGMTGFSGMMMPWITNAAVNRGVTLPFFVFAGLCACGAVATFLLPYDTRGKELDGKEHYAGFEDDGFGEDRFHSIERTVSYETVL